MVYGAFYLPIPLSEPLLSKTHHFDDSKVLTPAFRADLMEKLCTPPSSPASAIPASETTPDPSSLYDNCGWAVDLLSARSISSSMLHHTPYNLNAQAMDATIALIQAIIAKGVNVKEIYIDTIGQPGPYQKKLEKIFPTASVTVAKKADSLYPCVSAASVCAKVTRDRALEVLYEAYAPAAPTQKEDIQMEDSESKIEEGEAEEKAPEPAEADWGSGYPSDVRCTSWLKRNIDPIFGWGPECRFSWGTAKDLLENKAMAADVQWPVEQDDETHRLTDYFGVQGEKGKGEDDELAGWFGGRVGVEAF
jgi:ribonuclease H2 subunit A